MQRITVKKGEDWDKITDKKPLINQLVAESKWLELVPLLESQKRYDDIERYKAAEKTSFGLAKGYLNIFDVPESHWRGYLKDYFLTKYPDIKVLDYKNFFKRVRYSGWRETYKDTDNKLSTLDLNEHFYLMNMDTNSSQIYNYMLRIIKEEHNMNVNMYTCYPPPYDGAAKQLLRMKKMRLFQHIRYEKWNNALVHTEQMHDFIINY